MSDNVDHPSHYCDGRKYEPVEVILDWELDFLLGNALKYISRTGRKGSDEDAIEDLEKAVNNEAFRRKLYREYGMK